MTKHEPQAPSHVPYLSRPPGRHVAPRRRPTPHPDLYTALGIRSQHERHLPSATSTGRTSRQGRTAGRSLLYTQPHASVAQRGRLTQQPAKKTGKKKSGRQAENTRRQWHSGPRGRERAKSIDVSPRCGVTMVRGTPPMIMFTMQGSLLSRAILKRHSYNLRSKHLRGHGAEVWW